MNDLILLVVFSAYLGGTVCRATQTGSWRDWMFVPAWLVLAGVQASVILEKMA